MSVTMELISIKNPTYPSLPSKGRPSFHSSTSSMPLGPSSKFQSLLLKPNGHRLSFESQPCLGIPKGLGVDFRRWNRPFVAFAASHEDSKHSDIEVEKENEGRNLGGEESEEAWKQTLESFKEQALRLQSVSEEAYEVYSKKAMVVLLETSEQLKIQAEKANHDLSVLAKELGEEGKGFLFEATENSPELKEVVETLASSTDDLNDISKVRDFYLGLPYGLFLSAGGFLSFMLTGSISAIRFGVILGGALLTLSVSSLRSYKRGEPCSLALKGQAAIAAIIFLREISILSQRASFFTFLTSIISGAMVAFYLYRIKLDGKRNKGSDLGHGAEN